MKRIASKQILVIHGFYLQQDIDLLNKQLQSDRQSLED